MNSLITHNGKFTVVSAKTGAHRTFRVKTQDKDSNFAPGKRIVSMLVGANNETDYKDFAWATDEGVKVWHRYRNAELSVMAGMLDNMAFNEAMGRIEVVAETTCRVCNKCLTNPESVLSGIGPVCGSK